MSTVELLTRPPVGQEELLEEAEPGFWLQAWRRLRKNTAAMIALVVIVAFYLVALGAPLLAPYDPAEPHFANIQSPPAWDVAGSSEFLLGTDTLGRDMVSRLIYGARISMVVGLIPLTCYLLIGGLVGLIAGYAGGTTDVVLMRVVDVFYSLPDLLIIITLATFLRETAIGSVFSGLLVILLVLALLNWVGTARLIRGQVLAYKQQQFVEAARALGAPARRIVIRHIVPHVLAPIIVQMAFTIPGVIITESVLSFLGVGIRPPTASWGNMIQESFGAMLTQPTMALAPAACIAAVTLAFTFLGDGLRDALDPHMRI